MTPGENDPLLCGSNGAPSRPVRTTLVFTGEYDLAVKEQLREELDRLIDEPAVVLDFTDVTYVDSTCVAELMRNRDLRARHQLPPPTILMKAGGRIRRVFEMSGLLSSFDFVEELSPYETQVTYAFAGGTEELAAASHTPRAS